jgi:hypothetical protein
MMTCPTADGRRRYKTAIFWGMWRGRLLRDSEVEAHRITWIRLTCMINMGPRVDWRCRLHLSNWPAVAEKFISFIAKK